MQASESTPTPRAGETWQLADPGPWQPQSKPGDVVRVTRVEVSEYGAALTVGYRHAKGRRGATTTAEFMQRFRRVEG